jgi:hypothetical protein
MGAIKESSMLLAKKIILLSLALVQIPCFSFGFGKYLNAPFVQESDDLEAFLEDPVASFDRLKAIPNLCERVTGYDLKYVLRGQGPPRSFLDVFFERHFQEMDGVKMEIVLYLFKELRCCQAPIWEKVGKTFSLYPRMFAEALKDDEDWEHSVSGLSWDWDVFAVGLAGLGDSQFEKVIREYAHSLNQERGQSLEIVEAFIHDPVANFERIKTIDNVDGWIYRYELSLVEGGRLKKDPIGILLRSFDEIDEKKIEILTYLILRVRSGYHAELVMARASAVFKNHPQLFLRVLERMSEWKNVVDQFASWDPEGFEEGLEKAGESEFVKAIRKYLTGGQKEQQALSEEVSIDWDEVKKAFTAYESCPSKESARWLLATIPEQPAVRELGDSETAALVILDSIVFDRAIVAGDEVLAEAAFRLFYYMSGGAVDEELTIMLGRFLVRKPEAFLKLLKKYQHLFPAERDYPVRMTEILEIVPDITSDEDSNRRKIEETRLYMGRIKALERVEDPELVELRDACIRVIRTIIAGIERRIS